jgi:hypothetical protein
LAKKKARRLTKEEFVDRTLVRWKMREGGRRVAARDAELVRFVYEQVLEENYRVAFPDATESERDENEEDKK